MSRTPLLGIRRYMFAQYWGRRDMMEEKIPRNICRVGQPDHDRKVMVEEYVLSFLQELMKQEKEPQMIVFYGDGYEQDGIRYYFLKGAAAHRAAGGNLNKMDEYYFRTIGSQYFSQLKAIGWYYMDASGAEPLAMLRDMKEQNFKGLGGYYIYFEKNECMEEYMLQRQKNEIYVSKKSRKKETPPGMPNLLKKAVPPILAVQILNMISLCILIICCIIAVTTLNQYDKMRQLEETVTYLEISMEEQKNLPEE